MTKQEAIIKSYGDQWFFIDKAIQERILKAEGWTYELNVLWFKGETQRSNSESWRPLPLKGMDNNNGWIKIESEADLPKEDIDALFFIVTNGDQYTGEFKSGHGYFKSEYGTIYDHEVTHYQPIIKPKPPIY